MAAEKKLLMLAAEQVAVAQDYEYGDVVMQLDLAVTPTGMPPQVELGLRLSPDEAREVAAALGRAADAIERGTQRQ